MTLPDPLITEVRQGRVVLFLGAGASYGATRPSGGRPPLGAELRDSLSNEFLGGKYTNEPLAWVAELAISATDLGKVQDFVAEQFRGLQPAQFHHLVPTFRWRGLFTTNYDRLMEHVYDKTPGRIQELVPFISNNDRVDQKLRSSNHVALVKLHGCISRTHDSNLPLILTADQYITHRKGRNRLFKTLYEWGTENTIVFVGHALQDPDLRAILIELSKEIELRPRYYLVKPDADQVEIQFWGERRITVLPATFEEFLSALDGAIPKDLRLLATVLREELPIKQKYAVNEPVSDLVKDLLEHDAEYLHTGLQFEQGKPELFFKGFDLGWYPILSGLDVRRDLTDIMLWEVMLRPEEDRPTESELYVVKAEAGAGKTTFLRRIAWDAATQGEVLCLFTRPMGTPSFEAIRDLYNVAKERIFLFVDSAADNASLIAELVLKARRYHVKLTIITAERTNEWNMSCESIDGYVTENYRLKYLSHSETEELVESLRHHGIFGPEHQSRTFAELVNEFEERAGRQLLVALHEVTLGLPFEDILLDEFIQIHPRQAQTLYLTVCFLNRLDVPVRAGLIARVHNIPFSEFKRLFFAPLEHVVRVSHDPITGDHMYVARHPEIAQIVVDRALRDTTDRYNEYIRVLAHLNISFGSDYSSFRKLIRARSLHDIFPSYDDVVSIFEAAHEAASDDAYVFQQMANYERIRPNGNYTKAHTLLQKARDLAPNDSTIVHTLAELLRTRANTSSRSLQRVKFRNEAKSLLGILLADPASGKYARHTLVKLALDDLRDVLDSDESTARIIDESVRKAEQALESARQQYPEDYYLDLAEAEFGKLLRDNERSIAALQSAFETNPRDPYIATRLARVYASKGDFERAASCLRDALDVHRGNKQLNFGYAMILARIDASNTKGLAYHFRRAFTDGDDNHEAQFWYARYAFESDNTEQRTKAKKLFRKLRNVPMEHSRRTKVRDTIKERDHDKVFTGVVGRIEMTHGFVVSDGRNDYIFFHKSAVGPETWTALREGAKVAFAIGFSYNGPQAQGIEIL